MGKVRTRGLLAERIECWPKCGLRCFFQHLARQSHSAACAAASDRYNPERFPYPFRAGVAKSVDAVDSKSTVEIRAGSSPAFGTIGTSIDVNGRLFLCLKSSIRKAFRDFPFNRSQSESTHIKSLVSIEPSIYAGSIMVVYTQWYMEGELLWL